MKKVLLTSILALSFTGLHAQPLHTTPKLVVTLTIDQLRTDYLEAFSNLYGERGFKRIIREGKFYTDVDFKFDTDRASAVATLFSGATPSHNGIVGEQWLNPATLNVTHCVDDAAFMGNYTSESSSPNRLLTSNIGDELKIATRKRAYVYAVSPFRDAAILSAGHCADGAFWINENTGKWCSTTFYKDFPWWLSRYNESSSPDYRIKDIVWTPSYPLQRYTHLPAPEKRDFKYKFGDRDNRYRRLIASPMVNDEVNRLTEELLSRTDLGKDDVTDYLSLTYYGGNYSHISAQEGPVEMQDAYVKMDRSLSELLDILEKKVGLQNTLFVVCSTGYSDPDSPDFKLYNIPGGEFYIERCAALLNMFLMATYGQGQYVEASYEQEIYLNHRLIESKRINLAEIQNKSADFLLQCSGVDKAYSAQQILSGAWSPQMERIRNAFNRKCSGDILVEILPGWSVMNSAKSTHKVVRSANIPTPLVLMGPSLRGEVIRTAVTAEQLAPTLAKCIRIRAPNASYADPLF